MKSLDRLFVFSLYLPTCCINDFNINARCAQKCSMISGSYKIKITVLFLQNRLFQLLHQVKVLCGIAKHTQYDLLIISKLVLDLRTYGKATSCDVTLSLRAQDHASPVL